MTDRKTCPACHERPVAISYHKNGRTYYRARCDQCIRAGRKVRVAPLAWVRSGYKKKARCEQCGFKAHRKEQLTVYYLDRNESNGDWLNLRTVCLNCEVDLRLGKGGWATGAITPDF